MHTKFPEMSGARRELPTGARVLVGFGDALAAIECAWSLLEAGFEVSAFARAGARPPLRRLGSVELHPIAAPEEDAAAALAELRALVERTGVDAVMPLDDVALALCRDACEGTGATLVGPAGHQAEVALDKRLQLEAAAAAGLAVPPTALLGRDSRPAGLDFPLVVRPAAAVQVGGGRLRSSAGATTCDDAGELERALAGAGEGETLIAQPQLRGDNEGLFGLATPDGVRAWSAHRRVRMMNPAGSGSSACESIPVEAELRAAAERMLAAIGWTGLFMVELLRDERGVPWFIELNGRAWGSMALARAAGFEYPAWAARAALGSGAPAPPATPALPADPPRRTGRARHLGREIVHALIVMRGPRSAAVPWPSRAGTLRRLLTWRRGDRVYNWRGHPRELPLLLDDTVSTVARALSRKRVSKT